MRRIHESGNRKTAMQQAEDAVLAGALRGLVPGLVLGFALFLLYAVLLSLPGAEIGRSLFSCLFVGAVFGSLAGFVRAFCLLP